MITKQKDHPNAYKTYRMKKYIPNQNNYSIQINLILF